MHVIGRHKGVIIGLFALVCSACGGGSKGAAPAPLTEGDKADLVLGIPQGWSDANGKSAEHFRAGRYVEAIEVLEEFAKGHPAFADVELTIGDTWLTMPSKARTPAAERLEKAAAHLQRGRELATDDYGRQWADSSLARVAAERKRLAAP